VVQLSRRAFLLFAPLLLVATCGAGRIAIDVNAAAPVRPVVGASHEQLIDTIATIISRDIGLPMPADVRAFVYEGRDTFRAGLIEDAYVAPQGADSLASFAIGLARPNRVLLNVRGARGRTEWPRLIAHELTHVAQFALAGGDGQAEQWLAEGMAEHVAFQVLERLGLDSLEHRRDVARQRARNQAAFAQARLDLETLGSPSGFTLRHQREGSVETYQLAFLMADYLIEREGFPRVVEYFRLRRDEARTDAFANAFGQSIEEFEREVLAHLQHLMERQP
jgi:hypothetical protein